MEEIFILRYRAHERAGFQCLLAFKNKELADAALEKCEKEIVSASMVSSPYDIVMVPVFKE